MLNDVDEQVEVVAVFKENRAIPYIVRWRRRDFRVQKITLIHQAWEGNSKFFYFSALCEGAQLKLSFNTAELVWKLEQIWTQ